MILLIIASFIFSNLHACHHSEKINQHIEYQYEYYRTILESDVDFDRSYIDGKADAYRDMTYYLESYIYDKNH